MALRLVHGVEQAAQHLLHKVRQGHPNESECEMSDLTWTAILAVTNLLMLWIGFALGDDAHHEVEIGGVRGQNADQHGANCCLPQPRPPQQRPDGTRLAFTGSAEDRAADIAALEEAGVTTMILNLTSNDRSAMMERLQAFSEEVRPLLRR